MSYVYVNIWVTTAIFQVLSLICNCISMLLIWKDFGCLTLTFAGNNRLCFAFDVSLPEHLEELSVSVQTSEFVYSCDSSDCSVSGLLFNNFPALKITASNLAEHSPTIMTKTVSIKPKLQ